MWRNTGTRGCEERRAGFPGAGPIRDAGKGTGWLRQAVDSVRGLDRPRFVKEAMARSWSLGRWLLLAFVIEELFLFYVPQGAIAGVLGG